MLAIGLMSGTSLDGVDACLVEIKSEKYKILNFVTLPYTEEFRKRLLKNLSDDTAKLSEISSLNFELGYKFVDAIDLVLKDTKYNYKDIEFVASHGQTIWHDPKGNKCDNAVPSTLQIGEPSVISYKTGIKTIANFRSMDVVAGGEGAPLVPFSEYLLYRSETKNIVLQNIGGIGNLTYLKKGCKLNDLFSFDTGPGNIMIDYFMKKYFNKPYDANGDTARSGKVINELLDYLKQDEFIKKVPPKSTGREQYSVSYMEYLVKKFDLDNKKKEDVICTFTEYTAYSISYHYLNYLKDIDLAIINGGGSHNKYLIERIQKLTNLKIITGEEYGIDSDSKEALAFVVMGYQTLKHLPSNVVSVTGAKESVVLGNVTYNPLEYKNE